jgi:hypothetical protein
MSDLTRNEIMATLGPIDDHLIAEFLATGASSAEFTEARAWITNNEALMNAGAPLANGRVARLIDLLEAADSDVADEAGILGPG